MASSVEDASVESEIKEIIEEIEDQSDYSLKFDDDNGWREDSVDNDTPRQQQRVFTATSVVSTDDEPDVRGLLPHLRDVDALDASRNPVSIKPSPAATADLENDARALKDAAVKPIPSYDNLAPEKREAKQRPESASNLPEMDRVALDRADDDTPSIPVQVLNLETGQDVKQCASLEGAEAAATETLTMITREPLALGEILGAIQQELLDARQKVAKKATSNSHAARKKRVLAGARRMSHLEQLAEARRATAAAKSVAESMDHCRRKQALRARFEDGEWECGRTREMLEAARLARAEAEKRADDLQKELEAAKNEAEPLRRSLVEVQRDLEEQRKQAAIAVRNASNELELCERKRELEVTSARKAAEARERAAETELHRIPEHQQRLLQAELDRVARWEERLAAESVSLQRREEAHKIEVEACRAKAVKVEAESRARAEEDMARERAYLREARSAFEDQRGELLRRVAAAEAFGQAQTAEAAAAKVEATEATRRIEVERSALNTRAELLAPKFQALEEGRTALDLARREVLEDARRANQEACRARAIEAGVIEREAAVETRWQEVAAARRVVKQMEKAVAEESETLARQRKAVALARCRLHEQQMETSLQMSEIRQALDALKRVEELEDRGARRLALDLGMLALDRGARAAGPEKVDFERDVHLSREPEGTAANRTKRNATISCAPAGTCTSEGVKSILREVSGPPGKADESTGQGRENIGYLKEALQDVGRSQYSGIYAEEAATWDALEKVRSVIASSDGAVLDGEGVGSTCCSTWDGSSTQVWAKRTQAAANAKSRSCHFGTKFESKTKEFPNMEH